MKICAIVVTYNRLSDLKKNIFSLFSQSYSLSKIIIINNNSTDDTKLYLDSITDDIVCPIHLNENICGAGGFNIGLKIGYKQGYDYFILMDDDGYMANNFTLQIMVNAISNIKNRKIMINPLVLFNDSSLSFQWYNAKTKDDAKLLCDENGFIKNQISPFNGTLISKELVESIGFPNKDFVIRGDETDYEMRAKKSGAFVATVFNSLYIHPTVKMHIKKIFFKKIKICVDDPWKEYYRARNYRIIHGKKIEKRIKKRIFRSIILFDSMWFKRIIMIIHGLKDGRKGILGMRVKPGNNIWEKQK